MITIIDISQLLHLIKNFAIITALFIENIKTMRKGNSNDAKPTTSHNSHENFRVGL